MTSNINSSPVDTRIARTITLLQDVDILIDNLSDLVLRDHAEYLLIKHFREEKKKTLIKQATDALTPQKWFKTSDEK